MQPALLPSVAVVKSQMLRLRLKYAAPVRTIQKRCVLIDEVLVMDVVAVAVVVVAVA